MNYPIPVNSEAIVALRQKPVNEDLVVAVIVGVVSDARSRGQSLDELRAEVLTDDSILEANMRRWLSDVVAQAWEQFA